MKKIIKNILLFLFITSLFGCKKNDILYKIFYLDEAFSIVPIVTIMDKKDVIKNLNIDKDLSIITNDLDKKFNVFNEDSMISLVNKNAGICPVFVDEEFIYVLSQAIEISKETEINNHAMYDVSIFAIWNEWKFNQNYYQYNNYTNPPNSDIVKQKLPLVDYKKILINYEQKSVYLEKNMMIDLGSIVKGYAADKLSKYLDYKGFKNCLIDVGGNIVTLGKNIGTNNKWKTGILMPYSLDIEIGYIEANEDKETFVTSGIYQRYIVQKNEQTGEEIIYHHILNPLTGYPENNELVSVTIITKQSIIADAYSTAIFLLGLDKGLEYVNNNDLIEAVFITKDKEIILSENIKDRFIVNEEIFSYNYKIK